MRSSSPIQKQPIKNRQESSGIIVVDKPPNITSARVVADVKRLLGARKVGHAGTLDPFAEGVLVCCINDATRLARFLLAGDKTYDATLKLGIETDTQDMTGTVTAVRTVKDWPEDTIASVVKEFEERRTRTEPQIAVNPPSAMTAEPVTNDASSEARNAIAAATSCRIPPSSR